MHKDADDEGGRTQRAVQSVEVGGRLLLAMAEHPAPLTLKDLAARAGLPPARAHPYLVSFGRLGLVQQDALSGRYALGPAALQIGLAALHQCDPVRSAEPVAAGLAVETGQAVAVSLWGNFGPTVVRLIDAQQPLHVSMRVGTVMSVLGSATGRAFAAVLPTARIADALAAVPLGEDARSPTAAGGRDALDAALEPVRSEWAAHGCLRAVGRPIPGVNAFSAPVFDHGGQAVLVLTLLGHQDQVGDDWDGAMARSLRRAAHAVSVNLGWRASVPS